MLPFIPLAAFPPQRAKQVWIVAQILFLALSVAMLARLSGLSWLAVTTLALLAEAAVGNNFLLGQYYIFLLLLLTCAAWCLLRGREGLGGVLMGVIFALKLYTAPFLIYFVVRKQWRAVCGFVAGACALTITAIAIFGWSAVWFFATAVMPRSLDGAVNDPYNPGWSSMTAFLRHTFVAEAEWNPQPVWNVPWLFYFLHDVYTLGVLVTALLVLRKTAKIAAREALAWFVIVLFVLSASTASYHYVLLLLPIALLLRGASLRWAVPLIVLYIAVGLPLYSWDERLFPRAWLLLAMFLYVGWRFFPIAGRKALCAGLAVVAVVSAADAFRRTQAARIEPPQVYPHAVVEPDAIYSSRPSMGVNGLLYESMSWSRYVPRIAGPSGIQQFAFEGDVFHPVQPASGNEIYFELVSGRNSRICRFDIGTRAMTVVEGPESGPTEPAISPDGKELAFVSGKSLIVTLGGRRSVVAQGEISNPSFFPDGSRIAFTTGPPGKRAIAAVSVSGGPVVSLVQRGDCVEPAISPDGRQMAYACSETGARQIWVQNLASGAARRLTAGACTNASPAWDRDSRALIFASDCARGLGLTALYRASL